jgi:hypothetical protein
VGSQARILYSDQKGRVAIAVAINQAIASGKIKVTDLACALRRFHRHLITKALPRASQQELSTHTPVCPSHLSNLLRELLPPPPHPSNKELSPSLAEFPCRDTRFPEVLGFCGADGQRGLKKSCSGSLAPLGRQGGVKESMEGLASSQNPDSEHRSLWWEN